MYDLVFGGRFLAIRTNDLSYPSDFLYILNPEYPSTSGLPQERSTLSSEEVTFREIEISPVESNGFTLLRSEQDIAKINKLYNINF
jgi:hypothetical protein